jgi:hypothetical protein
VWCLPSLLHMPVESLRMHRGATKGGVIADGERVHMHARAHTHTHTHRERE